MRDGLQAIKVGDCAARSVAHSIDSHDCDYAIDGNHKRRNLAIHAKDALRHGDESIIPELSAPGDSAVNRTSDRMHPRCGEPSL
jgi:hypothetical protein